MKAGVTVEVRSTSQVEPMVEARTLLKSSPHTPYLSKRRTLSEFDRTHQLLFSTAAIVCRSDCVSSHVWRVRLLKTKPVSEPFICTTDSVDKHYPLPIICCTSVGVLNTDPHTSISDGSQPSPTPCSTYHSVGCILNATDNHSSV